jgi:hypothetical protein
VGVGDLVERTQPRIKTISVRQGKAYVLDYLTEMAQREKKSESYVALRCIEYYYVKKFPGNPQGPLFTPETKPYNIVAREEARLRQAMIFLRFYAHMSYRHIARVVGRGKNFVYRFLKSLDRQDFDARRQGHKTKRSHAFKRNLPRYQTRFRQFLEGKYGSVEEAFKW